VVAAAPIRVLVVDDDPLFRDAVSALLESDARVRVVGFAANGEEGLRRSLLLRPDVITMDIEMPLMDGVEATRRIIERLPDVRVLILSGSAHAHRAETARAAGASGYITKSRAADVLLACVVAASGGDEFVLAI
jgi:DNA-binding NarL/FixJ family response regulator